MPGDMRDRLDALQTIKGPTRSGVYFLWDGDRIAYVGSSLYGVFGHTIADHHHGARYGVLRKEFDRVSFLPVPAELLASVTSAFVRRLRPKYNKVVRVADDPDAERRDDDLLRCFGFAV